jgi:Reverse transcriptase (RNA-dependent DNA polymerase)
MHLRLSPKIIAQERKLGASIARTSGRARRVAIARYLQSYAAKAVAVRAAVPKASTGELEYLTTLNPWAGSTEPVKIVYVPKPNGWTRRTYSFGPERRALHQLVLNALNHAGPSSPSRNEVVQSVCTRLASEPAYVIELDVVDCFGTVACCPATISTLTGLPAQVVATLFCDAISDEDGEPPQGPSYSPINDGLPDSKVAEPRLGLPQGSAASPAIVERLLTPVLELLPQGKVVRYVDNFLIMADSREEAVSMLSALGDALAHHPAGSFSGKIKVRYSPGDTVEFLGYAITPVSDGCLVLPAPGKLPRFEDRIIKALQAAEATPHQRERRLEWIRQSIAALPNGFRLWPEGPAYAQEWLDYIEAQAIGDEVAA